MRVAVIGCGLIGRRRALVARQCRSELVIVADVDRDRALALAGDLDCLATSDWREAVARDDVDCVVVSTTNNWLAPVTVAALQHGKHVLVEKSMARNPDEAAAVLEAAMLTPVAPGIGKDNPILPNEPNRSSLPPVIPAKAGIHATLAGPVDASTSVPPPSTILPNEPNPVHPVYPCESRLPLPSVSSAASVVSSSSVPNEAIFSGVRPVIPAQAGIHAALATPGDASTSAPHPSAAVLPNESGMQPALPLPMKTTLFCQTKPISPGYFSLFSRQPNFPAARTNW